MRGRAPCRRPPPIQRKYLDIPTPPPPCPPPDVSPFWAQESSREKVSVGRPTSRYLRRFTRTRDLAPDRPQSDHLPALATLGPVVQLVAVYSRSEKSSSAFAQDVKETFKLESPPDVYHDEDPAVSLDVLLAREDLDAVIVVLPITAQPAIILKALAAGKHVLSEKPVAPDVERGRALIREYEAKYKPKGLVWRVAENFEAEPGYHAARKAIQDGRIGKVTFFNARSVNWMDEDSKWYKTPWRTVPDVSRISQ